MIKGIVEAFVALFVVMDPIGNIPLFLSLTKGFPRMEVGKNVDKSVFVAGVVLFVFLFLGLRIFDLFGINLDSFQIAGGIILLVISVLYFFGVSQHYVKPYGTDISVPVGTPLLTGPGVIMTTLILVKEKGIFITVIASILTLIATWFVLKSSSKLFKILGNHWTNVISRIMGIMLAAIAVKFITNGVLNIISPLL